MDEELREFRDFEHDGWEAVAEAFTQGIGTSTAQIIPALLQAVSVRPGERLLDVATGPGHLPAAANERGIDAVGVDFAQAMVDIASGLYPNVEFRRGAAEALPFGDAEFDAVVSAFGMPHFADHRAHFREARRVLRPGGRVGFATWYDAERSEYFAVLDRAFEAAGKPGVKLPQGPGMYDWSDVERCRPALVEAGFGDVQSVDVEVSFPLPDGAASFLAYVDSGVRGRAVYRSYSEAERASIGEALNEELAPYLDGANPAITAMAVVVAGRV